MERGGVYFPTMTAVELIVIILGLALGFGGTLWLTARYNLRKPNFRGDLVPSAFGLVIVLCGLFVYTYEWNAQGLGVGSAATYVIVTLGFGVLGLLDDVRGDRSAGGFRGHFRALARGRLTTGAAKALGGGAISLVAAFLIDYPVRWEMLLSALLIALSANTLNLIDLRPGRCLFAFFVGSSVVLGTLAANHALGVGFLFDVALTLAVILYPLDAGGRVMLGDTGANVLGAILGVAGALYFAPFWQGVLVALLLALQVWCERHSLSRTIDNTPWLRGLDRKIGVR